MRSLPLSPACSRCGFLPKKQRLHDDEAFLLTDEIRQLDKAILRLKERKARATTRLNAIQTPCKNLPDEVLSAIFEYAEQVSRPSFDMTSHLEPPTDTYRHITPPDRYFPMHVLGAVCSRWRRLAWSTRGLWTFFNLNVGDVINNEHGLMLPECYFENVGMRQMTLIVDCKMAQGLNSSLLEFLPSSRTKEGLFNSLRELIFDVYPERIAQLRLVSPPPEWLLLLSDLFPTLRGLELDWPFQNGRLLENAISFPQLHPRAALYLRRTSEVPLVLTHLQLHTTSFRLASYFLISCPNLISYNVWSVTPGDPGGLPNNQIVLPYLETFRWTWTSCDAHAKLLRQLRLPSLQYLYWTEYQSSSRETDSEYEQYYLAIDAFFSELPAHQLRLYLCQFSSFERHRARLRLFVILSSTPRLKYLGIHEPSVGQVDTLRTVTTIIKESRQRNGWVLPELEQLSLTGQACLRVIAPHSFIMLLDERRISGSTAFHLDVPGHGRIDFWWNDAVRCLLRTMVNGGYKLEITVGGGMIPAF